MGLGGLVLAGVDDEDFNWGEARMMAAEAQAVLKKAARFDTLAEALAGFDVAYAATRRVKNGRPRIMGPREAASAMVRDLGERKAAWVLGCEEAGLSAAEVGLCHAVVSIPSHPEFPSLNLAAAAMVLAWETRSASGEGGAPPAGKPAAEKEREALEEQVSSALEAAGFFEGNPRERVMIHLREVLGRGIKTQQEVRVMRGAFRRINWALRHPEKEGKGR